MRGLIPTSEWLEDRVPDVITPPVLYREPDEGWHAWAAVLTGLQPTRAGTHSGNIVAATAPGWAQWLALKRVMLTDPASDDVAGQVRTAFENGRPLSLLPPDSVERFADFSPVLRQVGDRYAVGLSDQRMFRANDHAQALDHAAQWLTTQRAEEIDRRRALSNQVCDELPPIYMELAIRQLAYDGILVSRRGDLVAMANGPHGFYLVASERWCYALERVSEVAAAKLAILAGQEDGTPLLLRPELYPIYVGLDGWTQAASGIYRWETGALVELAQGQWRVEAGDKRLALVQTDRDKVQILGKKRTLLAESSIPAGFETTAVLAWAAWRVLRKAREVL